MNETVKAAINPVQVETTELSADSLEAVGLVAEETKGLVLGGGGGATMGVTTASQNPCPTVHCTVSCHNCGRPAGG